VACKMGEIDLHLKIYSKFLFIISLFFKPVRVKFGTEKSAVMRYVRNVVVKTRFTEGRK
jgi:hypothetical protein